MIAFWISAAGLSAAAGALVLRSAARAGMLNISSPGDFEQHMPSIVDWFAEHPPGSTSGAV